MVLRMERWSFGRQYIVYKYPVVSEVDRAVMRYFEL